MATDRTILKQAQSAQIGSPAAADPLAPTGAVAQAHQYTIVSVLPVAATTAGNDYRFPLVTLPFAYRVVSAKIMPFAALTADDTNYTTVDLVWNDDAGGSDTVIATQTTKITGGSGNWVAGTSFALTVTAANVAVATGKALHAKLTHAGTGVVVAANTRIQVTLEAV